MPAQNRVQILVQILGTRPPKVRPVSKPSRASPRSELGSGAVEAHAEQGTHALHEFPACTRFGVPSAIFPDPAVTG
jgi:hypothetical protein